MHNILTLLDMSLFIILLLLIILMFPVSVPICSHASILIIFIQMPLNMKTFGHNGSHLTPTSGPYFCDATTLNESCTADLRQ